MKFFTKYIVYCFLLWQCVDCKRRGRLLSLLSFQDPATTQKSERTIDSTTSSSSISSQIVAPSSSENRSNSPTASLNFDKISQHFQMPAKSSSNMDSNELMAISRSSPVAAMLSPNIVSPTGMQSSTLSIPFSMPLLPFLIDPALPFPMPPHLRPAHHLSLLPHSVINHDLMSLGSFAHMIHALAPPPSVESPFLHLPVYKHDLRHMASSTLMDSSTQPMESESSLSVAQLVPPPPPSWWSTVTLPADRRQSGRKSANPRTPSVRLNSNRNKKMPSSMKSNDLKTSIVSMSKLQMLPNGYSKITIRRTLPSAESPTSSNQFLRKSSEIDVDN